MKPGRELDVLVAGKVMGWTDIEYKNMGHEIHSQAMGVRPGEVASPYTGYKPKFVVPKYSTDIAAAWEVVDAIRYKHGGGLLVLYRNGTDTYWCSFDEEEKPGVTGDTAPHAICLAALKAVGVEPTSEPNPSSTS